MRKVKARDVSLRAGECSGCCGATNTERPGREPAGEQLAAVVTGRLLSRPCPTLHRTRVGAGTGRQEVRPVSGSDQSE